MSNKQNVKCTDLKDGHGHFCIKVSQLNLQSFSTQLVNEDYLDFCKREGTEPFVLEIEDTSLSNYGDGCEIRCTPMDQKKGSPQGNPFEFYLSENDLIMFHAALGCLIKMHSAEHSTEKGYGRSFHQMQ